MGKLIAYIIIFSGFVIVFFIVRLVKLRRNSATNSYYDELRTKGKKLIVPFDKCEVKTREYYETIDQDDIPSRVDMLDALYDENRLHKQTRKVVSVIVYRYTDPSGKTIEFRTEPIYLELVNLRFLLEQKKQGVIYYDAANLNRYYFEVFS